MFDKMNLDSLETWAERLVVIGAAWVGALVVMIAFWIAARIIHAIAMRVGRRDAERQEVYFLLARVAHISFLILGVVTALGTAGVDVRGVIAGLGLTGFALGFALKDILQTTAAGVIILFDRPFRSGQRVKIGDFEGTVQRIDLRYTVIKTEDRTVLVPNSTVLNSPVSVLSPPAQ